MRHDVDFDPQTAKAMGYIEHQFKVHSSFYFRWFAVDIDQISYLKNLGHEVGLHYETLARYCEEHNITNRADGTPEVLEICESF